jgi:hypothetical protein
MIHRRSRSRAKSRSKSNKVRSKRRDVKPEDWPLAWPLPKGIKIISTMETYPLQFKLNNGQIVYGKVNNNESIVHKSKSRRRKKLDGSSSPFTPISGHFIEEQSNDWLYVVEMGNNKGNKISDVAFTNKLPTGTIIGSVPDKDKPLIRREAKQYALKNGIRW